MQILYFLTPALELSLTKVKFFGCGKKYFPLKVLKAKKTWFYKKLLVDRVKISINFNSKTTSTF